MTRIKLVGNRVERERVEKEESCVNGRFLPLFHT